MRKKGPKVCEPSKNGSPLSQKMDEPSAYVPLKENILGALPEHKLSQVVELCYSRGNREKVVASQLSNFARKAGAPIREEDFCFTEAAGIKEDLAWSGMAGAIFKAKAQVEVAQRYPGGFSTPAGVY